MTTDGSETVQVLLRMQARQRDALQKMAAAKGMSVNKYVLSLVVADLFATVAKVMPPELVKMMQTVMPEEESNEG